MSNDKKHLQLIKKFLVPKLRRVSVYWPERNKAFANARVERGVYKCNSCKGHFKKQEVQADHIEPILNIYGFTDWNDLINLMFVPAEGYQILCTACHDIKTTMEKQIRAIKKESTKKKTRKKSRRK